MAEIDNITSRIEETKRTINELKNSDPSSDYYEQQREEIQMTINWIREDLDNLSDEVQKWTLEQQINELEQEYNQAFLEYSSETESSWDQWDENDDNTWEDNGENPEQRDWNLFQGVKDELKKNPVWRWAIIVGWGITLWAWIKALVKRIKRKKKERENEGESASWWIDGVIDTVEKWKKTADGIIETVDRIKNIFGWKK